MQNAYHPKLVCGVLILSLSLILGVQMVQAKEANTISPSGLALTVNSTVDAVDANPGDGLCATATNVCTLRAAIQETNVHPGADAIILPSGVYTLTIPGASEEASATGDLDITDALKITGDSAETTIVDANGLDRVFDVLRDDIHVELDNLTIRHGRVVVDHEQGGGIYNRGSLLLQHSVVSDNNIGDYEPSKQDGAIYNRSGTLQLEQSLIKQNGKSGILNNDQVVINESRIALNQQSGILSLDRLGVSIQPHVIVKNSSIEQNDSGISAGELIVQNSKIINNNNVGISTVNAEISNCTIISNGSGINSEGSLSLVSSVISQNRGVGVQAVGRASIQASAVLSNTGSGLILNPGLRGDGFATIVNATIQGNRTNRAGGGIYNNSRLILDHVTIRDNYAKSAGGGLMNSSQVLLKDSTLHANTARTGGGIYVTGGGFIAVNSTISSNHAVNGGGLYNEAARTLGIQFYNVTVANNTAEQIGGGLYLLTDTLHLQNSIIATNHSQMNQGNDCYTTQALDSKGYNLIQDITNCPIGGINTGSLIGVDPKLGPLQANGGQGWTHSLLIDSPALDAGNPHGCIDELKQPLLTDQRGYLRAVAVRGNQAICDIGAVEFGDQSPKSTYLPQIFASSSSAILAKPPTLNQVAETSSMLGVGLILGSLLVVSMGVLFLVEGESTEDADSNAPLQVLENDQ